MGVKKRLGLVLLVLGGVGLVVGVGKALFFNKASVGIEGEKNRIADLKIVEENVLGNPKSTEVEIFQAMIRLAQNQNPLARTEALKRSQEGYPPLVREGAVRALGLFPDEKSQVVLLQLARDQSPTLRHQAIEALGSFRNPEVESFLSQISRTPGITLVEKAAVITSLYRVVSLPESKKNLLHQLIVMAQDQEAPSQLVSQLGVTLLQQAPKEAEVLNLLKSVLNEKNGSPLESLAIQHFSSLADPWMRENLGKLRDSKNMLTRISVIQNIHILCPKDRWKILSEFFKGEKERFVFDSAVRELEFLKGTEAEKMIRKVLDSKKLPDKLDDERVASLTHSLEVMKGTKVIDPCLLRDELPGASVKSQK